MSDTPTTPTPAKEREQCPACGRSSCTHDFDESCGYFWTCRDCEHKWSYADENRQPGPETRCPVGFAHPPHDYCDGNPSAKFFTTPTPADETPVDLEAMERRNRQARAAFPELCNLWNLIDSLIAEVKRLREQGKSVESFFQPDDWKYAVETMYERQSDHSWLSAVKTAIGVITKRGDTEETLKTQYCQELERAEESLAKVEGELATVRHQQTKLEKVVKDYGDQIIESRKREEAAKQLTGQAMAFAVPTTGEFDFLIFPDRAEAEAHVEGMIDESTDVQDIPAIVPLYAVSVSAVEGPR